MTTSDDDHLAGLRYLPPQEVRAEAHEVDPALKKEADELAEEIAAVVRKFAERHPQIHVPQYGRFGSRISYRVTKRPIEMPKGLVDAGLKVTEVDGSWTFTVTLGSYVQHQPVGLTPEEIAELAGEQADL